MVGGGQIARPQIDDSRIAPIVAEIERLDSKRIRYARARASIASVDRSLIHQARRLGTELQLQVGDAKVAIALHQQIIADVHARVLQQGTAS